MSFLDLHEATLWTRIFVAVLAFLALAIVAAGSLVAAMMFVLFSADASSASEHSEFLFNRAMYTVLFSLAFAVVVPPILLLLKTPSTYCAIPAGLGFACAGVVTMWYILATVGGN